MSSDEKTISCWMVRDGYVAAEISGERTRYTVTRPGDRTPFAYTPDREEISILIDADERAMA